MNRYLRIAIYAVVTIVVVAVSMHLIVNGLPSLGSLNPHAN